MPSAELFLSEDELRIRRMNGEIFTPSADEVYSLKVEGGSELRDIDNLVDSPEIEKISFSRYPLEPRIKLDLDDKGALHCMAAGIHEGTLYMVPGLLGRVADHIVVNSIWMPILKEPLFALEKLLSDLKVSCPGGLTLKQYIGLSTHADAEVLVVNAVPASQARPLQTAEALAQPLPKGLSIALYPYQDTGFRWLTTISAEGMGCLLGDEMGLGKTAQVIALLAHEKEAGAEFPSLVLAPSTILENWRREFEKFAPSLSIAIHKGRDRSGLPSELKKTDVIVTSYETAVRDLPLFKMIRWNLVVLDEAQAIKNPDARRTQAVKKLPKRVGVAVTGTPVENRLSDLWSIMDFALPNYLGGLAEFQSHFEGSVEQAAVLEPRITPLLLRRRVQEVARDLPERIDIPQPLELSEEGAQEYEAIRQEIEREYGEAANLVALSKLRMYCSHPLLLQDFSADPAENSPKYQRMLEILEEIFANREKALLFTAFNKMTDIIVSDVHERLGVYVDFIDGRTQTEVRQIKVDEFSKQPGAALLVLNPRTAGTGLNITAANHVLHYSLEWNPAVEDQASARAYRRGQTKPVTVHRFFYVSTVEDVINDRIAFKRQLAAAAIVGTSGAELEKDEILKALHTTPLHKAGVVQR